MQLGAIARSSGYSNNGLLSFSEVVERIEKIVEASDVLGLADVCRNDFCKAREMVEQIQIIAQHLLGPKFMNMFYGGNPLSFLCHRLQSSFINLSLHHRICSELPSTP